MDLKSKGITWVGSIYQKFESVCQEVDSLMAQEKVKYIKRQVQVSCENVQKLYVETVQDLIPFPSGDSIKGYHYIADTFEREKTKVSPKECLQDERLFSPSQSEGIASVDKDSSAIPLADSCSADENMLLHCPLEAGISLDKDSSAIPLVDSCVANENMLLHCSLETGISLDKDSSAIPLVDSCAANENMLLHGPLEAGISLDKDSSAIPLVDSCAANENMLLHCPLEAGISLDKDSRAIPLVDSCAANENMLLHCPLEAAISLDKDSSAIPLVDSCAANENMLLHCPLEAGISLDKDSSAIPLMNSCSANENMLQLCQLEASISSDKDSSAIPLVESCSANENMLVHHQLDASISSDKDSSVLPLVNSCSANENALLHHELEASISSDKDSSAIPLVDSCSANENALLHAQLEASASLDKASCAIPLVDSYSANGNALLHPQLETSVSMDKDSSVNACSANESVLLHSQFEGSISLNESSGETSPCSGCFTDEELCLPFRSKSRISMDEVLTAELLLDVMLDRNQLEACDAMIDKSNRVSVEATEQYYTQRAGENDGNSEVVSCVSESSNVLPTELVIPAVSHEKVVEHGLTPLVLGSSTDVTGSSEGANRVETHDIATEESTQISTEVAEHNCPGKTGGNNNVPYEVSSIGCPSSILQSKLVLQDVSHRKTLDNRLIPSCFVSSLSIDVTGSSASTLHSVPHCANHTEGCIKLAKKSIPLSEVIGREFPERAEEKNAVSGADVEGNAFRSPNEMSQVESPCKKCEKDSKHAVIGASVQPMEIATSPSLNNFDWEEASKRAYAVGSNSMTEEEFEDVKLDDDYVDSEEEKDEIYLISLLASKKRSYKDALLARIRTTKRDDREEIIAWYRDFNKNTKQRRNLKEMLTQDGAESDWELV